MNTTGGGVDAGVVALTTNSWGWQEYAGGWEGAEDGDANGDAEGDCVLCATPTGEWDPRRGPDTTSTPTRRTAMTAAATAAIQYGPRASGAPETAL
jgi:hypothetical protein